MPGFNNFGNKKELLHSHRWKIDALGDIRGTDLFLARDLAIPQFKINTQEVLGGLIYYNYAKSVKWDPVDVVFYDDGVIYGLLDKWRKVVYDNTTGINKHSPSGGYKKECTFSLLDGRGNPVNKYILKNAWPLSLSHSKVTYTNSEVKQVNVTLSYDYAEVK